jgi:hypothetical protein
MNIGFYWAPNTPYAVRTPNPDVSPEGMLGRTSKEPISLPTYGPLAPEVQTCLLISGG